MNIDIFNNNYEFDERRVFSDGNADSIEAALRQKISGIVSVERANNEDDRSGADYWVCTKRNKLSVDVKQRSKDYATDGDDDLALETWSVLPRNGHAGKIGWTRDIDKNTDYILWYWRDTGRFQLVPFPALCFVFTQNWEKWSDEYRGATQNTVDKVTKVILWQSECVFVPRKVLMDEILKWSCS